MYKEALEVLKKLEEHGFKSYIVGGYPRDKYLGIESTDIDICTSATLEDINLIFDDVDDSFSKYGAYTIKFNSYKFKVTTFRIELSYSDNRHVNSFLYVDNLEEDLKRRDFTINTLCINSDGELIDLIGARRDIDSKMIIAVDDAYSKLKEDFLRILRAIRFATVLNFKINDELDKAISLLAFNVPKLSRSRIKEELDKIFKSSNYVYGISLLKKYSLDEYLNLKLDNINNVNSYIDIWANICNVEDYPFTKEEKKVFNKYL